MTNKAVKSHKKPRIFYTNLIVPPFRAMTIPPFGIFVRKKFRGNKKIINHDLVHWKQYQERGFWKFYYRYFYEWIKYGYDKMPMEMEARYEEDEYTKNNYSKVYHR